MSSKIYLLSTNVQTSLSNYLGSNMVETKSY